MKRQFYVGHLEDYWDVVKFLAQESLWDSPPPTEFPMYIVEHEFGMEDSWLQYTYEILPGVQIVYLTASVEYKIDYFDPMIEVGGLTVKYSALKEIAL